MALSDEVAGLRVAETSARESFMRSFGAHLPPIFLYMVPSLKDKPPYFDPRLTEAQWLPDVDTGHWSVDEDVYERGNYENRHDAMEIKEDMWMDRASSPLSMGLGQELYPLTTTTPVQGTQGTNTVTGINTGTNTDINTGVSTG